MDRYTFVPILEALGVRVHVDYQTYLHSKSWQRRARACRKRAGYRCQVCKRKAKLQAHHLTYERLGHEKPTDLMALCSQCHRRVHEGRYGK